MKLNQIKKSYYTDNSVDNFELIKPYLKFDTEDDFYFVEVIQRKKENETMNSNSRLIRPYYINNLEYFENVYNEIKDLCYFFNARAMIRLNRLSYKKVALKNLEKLANTIVSESYKTVKRLYHSSCGSSQTNHEKYWILDIDYNYSEELEKEIIMNVNSKRPYNIDKYVTTIPSKNGFHIITKPFDVGNLRNEFNDFEVDIHKNNLTNLFIP